MPKRKKDGEQSGEPEVRQPSRIGTFVKGVPGAVVQGVKKLPGAIVQGAKSLVPEPRYVSDGPWCGCCGSHDHKAAACPKNPCPGFYDKRQPRTKRFGRKKKGEKAPATEAETPIAA